MSSHSSSRSPTPSKASKQSSVEGYVPDDFRFDILEQNNIFLADGILTPERWSDLAFSLGLSAREGQRFTTATQKLVQRMKKRKLYSAQQTNDHIQPFIASLVATCPKLSQKDRCAYHHDAVPTIDALKNTVHRLPVPKPAISVGYHRAAFSLSHDELQSGIIAGPNGDPCDLHHISQPVSDHFWPFFVVEVSENSVTAARQASAISSATCNNGLDLLAGAAADDQKDWNSASFVFDRKFAKSFSLSVHGKHASLSVHGAEGVAQHVSQQISTYRLDDENEVASLADRIHGIMVWAQYSRLGEIIATLDQLNRKVYGNVAGFTLGGSPVDDDFDPACLKTLKLQPLRRPERMKAALRAGLPSWLGRS